MWLFINPVRKEFQRGVLHGIDPVTMVSTPVPLPQEQTHLIEQRKRAIKAAKQGKLIEMQLLLRQGMSIDERVDGERRTLLMIAAQHNQLKMMRFLLSRKANIALLDVKGNDALNTAVNEGHPEIVRFLLSLQPKHDLNKPYHQNRTLLMTAAQYGHLRLAQFLVEQGANVNAANSVNAIALKSPATLEQRRLPAFAATMSDLYATNPAGWTALTFAANWGHADMVKFLLSRGAHVSIRDKSKRTPLYYAQSVHHPEVVRILKDALAKGK